MECIAYFEINDKCYEIIRNEKGQFDVLCNKEIVQPNHTAEGIMRYMANIIYNQNHLMKGE